MIRFHNIERPKSSPSSLYNNFLIYMLLFKSSIRCLRQKNNRRLNTVKVIITFTEKIHLTSPHLDYPEWILPDFLPPPLALSLTKSYVFWGNANYCRAMRRNSWNKVDKFFRKGYRFTQASACAIARSSVVVSLSYLASVWSRKLRNRSCLKHANVSSTGTSRQPRGTLTS